VVLKAEFLLPYASPIYTSNKKTENTNRYPLFFLIYQNMF
jgi:hypothetical protein